MPAVITANTWRAGVDRILLGVAVADDDPCFTLGDVVPLGAEADDAELVGRQPEAHLGGEHAGHGAAGAAVVGAWEADAVAGADAQGAGQLAADGAGPALVGGGEASFFEEAGGPTVVRGDWPATGRGGPTRRAR